MKKRLTAMLILATILASATGVYAEQPQAITNQMTLTLEGYTAIVNGQKYTLHQAPVLKDGELFLPVRFGTENLIAATVTWDNEEKKVRIRRWETLFKLTLGSKEVLKEDETVLVETAPVIENDSVMLSAKALEQLFDIKAEYNQQTKTVIITGEDKRPNDKPTAEFSFTKMSYVEGERVVALNTSKDYNHDRIADTLWSIEGENPITAKDLSSIFDKPKAGTYKIGLKVQDQRGLWSDWTYKKITIRPNYAPKITSLETSKESYAQGEAIALDYSYQNEEGEAIVNEKWTYRSVNDEAKQATLAKPNFFLHQENM